MPTSLSSEHTDDTLRPPPNNRQSDVGPLLESGIPPGGMLARTLAARGEAHAQLALAGCARADANLGSLLRSVQHLAAAVNSAREARDDVVDELEHLRTLLSEADEEQHSLRHRASVLEQTLERTEREAARERAFLIDEQDSFIGALWDEHAAELADVRRRLSTTEEVLSASQDENQRLADAAHSASLQTEEMARRLRKAEADLARVVSENSSLRDTLTRLQTEREEALLAASQTARERDQIRADLGRLRSTSSPRAINTNAPASDAIPLVTRSDSRPPTRGDVSDVDAPALSSNARTPSAGTPSASAPPPSDQRSPSSIRRAEVHPEELRAALTNSEPPSRSSGTSSSRPQSSRPMSGYSLAGSEVPEDTIDTGGPNSRSRSPSR